MTATTTSVNPLGKIRTVKLASVKPYPRNPRKVPAKAVEQTAKSISQFGWQQPIVVDAENVIIAGHTRWAAAKHLGLDSVPVVVADRLSPEQVKAFRVADNRSHDYTTWDYPELIAELGGLGEEFTEVLDLTDWAALMTAFEAEGNTGQHDLPDEEGAPIAGTGYTLSVEFGSREEADRAGPELFKFPGVINVRHAHR